MEERRLKTILSHLSACSPSQMRNSSVSNTSGKGEKHIVSLPDNTHLQRKKQVARMPISRSRSSSDMLENRLMGLAGEFPVRGDAWYADSREELPSHVMQSSSGSWFHHDCSSSGAAKLEWGLPCKSLHFKDELIVNVEENLIDSRRRVPFEPRVSIHQNQVPDASLRSFEGDHHQEIVHEPQVSSRASEVMRNTKESDSQTFRDLYTPGSQSAEAGNDAVGSISRNNVMTGQRRRIVEDCIFCLIIQGQSPAFKIYEDDMCVCILDVHPLSHGHSLLIPKTHFPSLELTPPEVAAAMCATVPLLSMAIMQATNCDSFNLLVNSGKAAGQVVFHTHFHIIPRRTGDNLWRSEDCNRRSLPVGHETAVLVQQIRHNLSNKHC